MDEIHIFIPLQVASDAIAAGCSCGWTSAYSHAYEKYAREDHDFHVENAEKEAT